jgi:hypothetical protein
MCFSTIDRFIASSFHDVLIDVIVVPGALSDLRRNKWPASFGSGLICCRLQTELREIRLGCSAIAHRDLPIEAGGEETPLSSIRLHPEG